MAVVLRGNKGTPLTHEEMDGNFQDLDKRVYSTTTDPTVTDDASAGFDVGYRWTNKATGLTYKLTDSTVGAAVWEEESSGDVELNNLLLISPAYPAVPTIVEGGHFNIVSGENNIVDGNANTVSGMVNNVDGSHNYVTGSQNTLDRSDNTIVKGSSHTVGSDASIVMGNTNICQGDNSLVFGYGQNNTRNDNILFGSSNTANQQYCFALGAHNEINQWGSLALGHYNQLNGEYSFVLGRNIESYVSELAYGINYNDRRNYASITSFSLQTQNVQSKYWEIGDKLIGGIEYLEYTVLAYSVTTGQTLIEKGRLTAVSDNNAIVINSSITETITNDFTTASYSFIPYTSSYSLKADGEDGLDIYWTFKIEKVMNTSVFV